jgi:hypothetical protein
MKTPTRIGELGILLLFLFFSLRGQVLEQRSNILLVIGGYYSDPNFDEINAVYRT